MLTPQQIQQYRKQYGLDVPPQLSQSSSVDDTLKQWKIAADSSKDARATMGASQPSSSASSGGFLSSVGGVAKSVGNALTSSEQMLGKGLSTVGSSVPTQIKNQSGADFDAQQKIINAIHQATDPAKKQHLTDFLKQQYGTDLQTPTAGDINPGFNLSNKQVIGSAAGTLLDVASVGTYGEAAKGAETGKLFKPALQVPSIASGLTKETGVVKGALQGAKSGNVSANKNTTVGGLSSGNAANTNTTTTSLTITN